MRSSRRDTRDYGPPQVGADGWTTPAVRPPTKAGDLSNFGKISKSTAMQFGPSSIFSKKEWRESSSVTRASSSSSMFAALNSSEATSDNGPAGPRTAHSARYPSWGGNIDLSAGSVTGLTPQRKRFLLQPRMQIIRFDSGSVEDDGGFVIGRSEMGDEDAVSATYSILAAGAAPAGMSLEQAKRKIKEHLRELFMLRQRSEAEGYFSALPAEFRWYLVEELVHPAVDARAIDVQLISDVFDLVASKSLVDEEQFSRGFAADMEHLEDTSTDSPNAYGNVARLLKASKLSQLAVERYDTILHI
jgi:translation initiation factor 4G